ncbi:MAG: LTA synthase family protein [Rhodanobacteraceae bacterium]
MRIGLGIFAATLLLGVLIGWLDPAWHREATVWNAELLGLIALNVLPALILFLLMLALTRRVLLAIWFSVLIVGALYAADAQKLRYLGTPLLPADLRLLGDTGPAVHLLSQYLHVGLLQIVELLLGLGFTIALFREKALVVLRGWRRWLLALAALLVGGTLIAGSVPWPSLYNADRLDFHPWALKESSNHVGLIGTLLLYQWQFAGGDIPPADRKAAAALLLAHANALRTRLADAGGAAELPDIIVLQSESLFDPARLRDVPEGRWLRNFHQLANSATSGNMHVPTFGGGTIRTEFEVLTGAPLASLGGIQYPWLELNRNRLPGLVQVLDAHGYHSIAIHPNSAAFWNRARAFPALGFDRFIDNSTFSPDSVVGLFIGDAALTDRVLAELDGDGANSSAAPKFLFAISMENHGPFDWRPGLDPTRLAALPMPDKLDAGGRLWFGNYLYLLDDADDQLGRLARALGQRKRRTLLLFYGDHLPSLAPVYFQLGFKDGKDAKSEPVPWLLFDTAHPEPHALNTDSWLLPTLLLDAAGIGDATYFTIMDTLRNELNLGTSPIDAATEAGIDALARLQLRGELDAFVRQTLSGAATSSTRKP